MLFSSYTLPQDLAPFTNQITDSGTTHISVVDPQRNAVSLTSSVLFPSLIIFVSSHRLSNTFLLFIYGRSTQRLARRCCPLQLALFSIMKWMTLQGTYIMEPQLLFSVLYLHSALHSPNQTNTYGLPPSSANFIGKTSCF